MLLRNGFSSFIKLIAGRPDVGTLFKSEIYVLCTETFMEWNDVKNHYSIKEAFLALISSKGPFFHAVILARVNVFPMVLDNRVLLRASRVPFIQGTSNLEGSSCCWSLVLPRYKRKPHSDGCCLVLRGIAAHSEDICCLWWFTNTECSPSYALASSYIDHLQGKSQTLGKHNFNDTLSSMREQLFYQKTR